MARTKRVLKTGGVPRTRRVSTTEKRIERVVKGFANHWRIRILVLLDETPELSVGEITDILDANAKTIGVHLQRLAIAGLIMKRYQGRSVRHALTPLGNEALISLRKLEYIIR